MTKFDNCEALYLDMYDAILINKTMKANEANWLRFMELMSKVEGLEEARHINDNTYSWKIISEETHEAAAEMLSGKARCSLRDAERCAPAMKDGADRDADRDTMAAVLGMDAVDKASWLKFIEAACREEGLEEAMAYNMGAFYEFENISQETYEAAEKRLKAIARSALGKAGRSRVETQETVDAIWAERIA